MPGPSSTRGKKPAGPGDRLTASQLYTHMVSRNELAQMSIDDLHKEEAFAAAAANASTDTLAKPTKRHDGASYTALGIDANDSEEETALLEEEDGSPRSGDRERTEKPRAVQSPTWFSKAHNAMDEWVTAFKERLQKDRRARAAFILAVVLVVFGLFRFALTPSQRSALNPWKPSTTEPGQSDDVEPPVETLPDQPTQGVSLDGQGGLLDLRPGEAGSWYKSLPGPQATGALPFWATAASLPTGTASYTRGHKVYQTAVAGDNAVQKLAPFTHMGPLTPYQSAPGFGVDNHRYRDLSALMPDDQGRGTCKVNQVHILHRHGARYPTSGSPVHAVQRIARAREEGRVSFTGPLAFLQGWSYGLGAELLTPPGRLQLYHSGVQAHMQYAHLVGEQHSRAPLHPSTLPDQKRHEKMAKRAALQAVRRQWGWGKVLPGALLVRAGSQRRIVDSALSWLQGFYGPQLWNDFATPPDADLGATGGYVARALRPRDESHESRRIDLQVHPEGLGWNTTLASHFACPAAVGGNKTTAARLSTARATYLQKAVDRLQPHVQIHGSTPPDGDHPGESWDGKLTPDLLNGMQQLCSYETVALGQSSFCGLFTAQEWSDYEHVWDSHFHGYFGTGTPLGAAQGIGWVNEFVARLTNQPWNETIQTSENVTVNADSGRFPTDENQRVFVDFTHDSILTSVLAALGADELNTLPTSAGLSAAGGGAEERARFRTSHLVPFGARMVFERLSCGSDPQQAKAYVRMILNDAVVPLSNVGCAPRADGVCALDEFLRAVQDRNQRANFHGVCGQWAPEQPLP